VGVAVLGSVLSSHYGPALSSALAGKVPAPIVNAARDSVGRAVGVVNDPAHPVGARIRAEVVSAAHHSFIGGLHLASLIAAAIVLIAVVGVLVWLPARAVDERAEQATPSLEPEPVESAVAAATVGNLAVVLERE